VRADDERGRHVNWNKIEHGGYEELGGVRIEDVVYIDYDGEKKIPTRSSW
jgi:hypothetical protein